MTPTDTHDAPDPMPALTVLHLSGLHLEPVLAADAIPVFHALADELSRVQLDEGTDLDLVVISGNLTHSGAHEDFHEVQLLLHETIGLQHQLGPSRFAFAAGPTDGLRATAHLRPLRPLLTATPDTLDAALTEPQRHLDIFERFLPFNLLSRTLQECQVEDQDPRAVAVLTFEHGALRIGVATFNTAWLCLDSDAPARLAAPQLHEALTRLDAAGVHLRLAVLHHHPDALPPAVAAQLRAAFDLIFCAGPAPTAPVHTHPAGAALILTAPPPPPTASSRSPRLQPRTPRTRILGPHPRLGGRPRDLRPRTDPPHPITPPPLPRRPPTLRPVHTARRPLRRPRPRPGPLRLRDAPPHPQPPPLRRPPAVLQAPRRRPRHRHRRVPPHPPLPPPRPARRAPPRD